MKPPIRMTLLENAYDFLNESLRSTVEAERRPSAWKFAVLNVVQAIELLLKARLYAVHPVLVYENVDRRSRTVSLTLAVERIIGAAGIDLTNREQRTIRKAQRWRDSIVHHEFEMSTYEVESVYVGLFEFLQRFHDEHTDFGVLHDKIDRMLWKKEAELMEFFRREFVTYNGMEVIRSWPAKIVSAQSETVIPLHDGVFDRVRFGREIGWPSPPAHPCHDCAVVSGQIHVVSCDVEQCPRCMGQLIGCGCLWDEGPTDAEIESREPQAECG